ncbi:hypothetical protein [Breznakia pachnodae]|uniref:Uncharacterized protein n=1 Tax=Breznakia pachnodae TaxID=265178 RepID=A0ABU0E2B4_9FIRM|nr:hypothetical protein [Breznakia pachnodae]MDQ0360848.1 hypothetical protein [Breznakia pachnodae]
MKKKKGIQISLIISLLAGIWLAYILFNGIFKYGELSNLFGEPFYYANHHITDYVLLLLIMSSITVYFVYQTYITRDEKGNIKYLKMLIISIIQSVLEFSVYFILFFLENDVLSTSYQVFAWYNAYDFIKIAYYLFCFSFLLKIIIIIKSMKMEEPHNYLDDEKLKYRSKSIIVGYGLLLVILYIFPSFAIKREIILNIPFEEQMRFVGYNGEGNMIFDDDNGFFSFNEYYVWEETKDMNEVLKSCYASSGDAEIISNNNGKLKNGDKVDIRWKEKTENTESELNIKINSEISTYTVEGLPEKVLFEDLTDSQRDAVEAILGEYINSEEWDNDMMSKLDVDHENYEIESVDKLMIVDSEYLYDNSLPNDNILNKLYANNSSEEFNYSKGDIDEVLVYEIVLKHPTNDNKVYYYVGCNLSKLSGTIVNEQSLNDISMKTTLLTYSSTQMNYDSIVANESNNIIKIKTIYTYDIDTDKFPATWDSRQIMINGEVIAMPANISNFNDMGYDFNSSDKEKRLKSKDSVFSIELNNDDNEVITATLYNASDSEADIRDCTFLSLIVDENSGEVYLPGGFRIGSSIRDIRMLYGTPYDVIVDDSKEKLVYSSDWGMIDIDFNNGKLEQYKIVINFENAKLSNDNKDE